MVLELEMALFPSAKIDGTKIFYVTYLMFFSQINLYGSRHGKCEQILANKHGLLLLL